jgi:uncharacterized PurR-regulated membrane protein YhhQ (DUF165 family)
MGCEDLGVADQAPVVVRSASLRLLTAGLGLLLALLLIALAGEVGGRESAAWAFAAGFAVTALLNLGLRIYSYSPKRRHGLGEGIPPLPAASKICPVTQAWRSLLGDLTIYLLVIFVGLKSDSLWGATLLMGVLLANLIVSVADLVTENRHSRVIFVDRDRWAFESPDRWIREGASARH